MGSHGNHDDYDEEEDPLRSEEFLIYVPILSITGDKLPPPPPLKKKKNKKKRQTKRMGVLSNDTANTVVAAAAAAAPPPSIKLRNGNDDEKERIGHDSSPSRGGGGGSNNTSSKGKGKETTTTTMIHIRTQEKKTVQITEQLQITTLTVEEMEERFVRQHDLWYQRAELMEKRNQDCRRLIVALRAMQTPATTTISSNNNNNTGSLVGRDTADNHQESFCIRGLEIVLHKKQRDEVKRRAAQTVFWEQRRANNILLAANATAAAAAAAAVAAGVVESFPRKAPAIPRQAREKRAEGDSSSSDDSDSGGGDDVDDMDGSRECDFWFKRLVRLEERIAERYSLAAMTCRDDAYLRGLKDAQDARTIFLEETAPPAEEEVS